jgi:hypothetical protein
VNQKGYSTKTTARIRKVILQMKNRRGKTLLLIALVSFIVVLADPIRTYLALEKPGFYEANTTSRWW